MGRPGEFFDQDVEGGRANASSPPDHAGRGMLYDQDSTAENIRFEASVVRQARRERVLDRQRERELELRREQELEHEREARRRRVREAQRAQRPPGPLQISSRPGAAGVRAGPAITIPPPPPPPPPPQPPRRRPPAPAPGPARAAVPSAQRATAILAAGTFASRITGFLRVLAIGYVLGVGSLSDAYNYANGVPNIVYDLLLGGVLSATLIPVFVDQLRGKDRDEGMRAVSAVLSAVAVALVAITALLWLLAPWVIHFYLLLNPHSTGPAERSVATTLLRYFAPQVFFLGAIVVTTALLNARRSFTAAAVSPVVNNLVAIAAILTTKFVAGHILTNKSASPATTLNLFGRDQHAIWILGIGTTLGYVVQLLVQLPAMRRAGFRIKPVWDLHHPAVRRVAQLSSWLVAVVVANQVSLALVMVLAGKVQGGVTAYQFSYQFFQLPYALIAVSVASALMPDLAERWSSGDRQGFERRFVAGLRVTLALLIPVGLAYVAIAQPFIQLAVHHGRVTPSGAHLVGSTLALFAVGLPGFSAFFLLMRAYQAMQNARAMFWIYALENALTIVAALALDPVLGVPGLALAWAGPYTIASIVAAYDLRRRMGNLGGTHTVRALVRIFVAGGVAAAVVAGIGAVFPSHEGDAALVARLIFQVGLGTAVYVGLARMIGIKELRPVIRLLKSGSRQSPRPSGSAPSSTRPGGPRR